MNFYFIKENYVKNNDIIIMRKNISLHPVKTRDILKYYRSSFRSLAEEVQL